MTSRAVALRLAQATDARAMALLSRELIEQGLPWRYTPGRIGTLINEPDTTALVAADGPLMQGFAVMHFGDERAHLMLLCVQQAAQRRGIGQRLLDWLVLSARVAGLAAIDLELRADNDTALAFYQRQAFTQTQWLASYYRGDIAARRMSRRLREP